MTGSCRDTAQTPLRAVGLVVVPDVDSGMSMPDWGTLVVSADKSLGVALEVYKLGEIANSGLVNQPAGALPWVIVRRLPLAEVTVHVPFAAVVQWSGLALGTEKRTPAVPATELLLVRSPPAVMVMAGWLGGGGAARAGRTVSPSPATSVTTATASAKARALPRNFTIKSLSTGFYAAARGLAISAAVRATVKRLAVAGKEMQRQKAVRDTECEAIAIEPVRPFGIKELNSAE